MSGVTPLVDTLLATRLGQRVDLVPLKAELEIAGPGAVVNVEKVANDVRLPSREALQRELGPGLVGRDGAVPGFAQARHEGAVTLSAAARTVSALLNLPVGTTPAVRGRAPLQPDLRTPAVPVLTAALARTVAESGLFYESHLQQFAAGQRTLAQLAREPQAAMAAPAAGAPPADEGLVSPGAAAGPSIYIQPASLALPAAVVLPPVPPEMLEAAVAPAAGRDAGAGTQPPNSPSVEATHPPAPATSYGRTGLPDPAPPSPHDFSGPDAGTTGPAAASPETARAGHPAAAIHPELVGLVRQQLDMLALPVFRWSGEGWPGIPLDWEIRREGHEHEEAAGRESREDVTEAAPSAWTTRMTLKLPRLGTVDARLGLAGAALQLRLDASQEGTVAVLNQAGAELSRRLGAVGLELVELRIGGAADLPDPAGGRDAG
jgi:hypothetical protein